MTLARITAKKLTADEIQTLVNTVVEELSVVPDLKAMILFGSASEKTMTEASDLDVVMVFGSEETARQASKNVHGLRKKALWPMDILCIDVETYRSKRDVGGVYFVAHREGKLIFGEAP